jgi:hypothetical protein
MTILDSEPKIFLVKFVQLGMMLTVLQAAVAQAGPVVWNLERLTFSDGASGAGYFVFDAALLKIVDWNITTTSSGPVNGSIGLFAGYDYFPLTSLASANVAGCGIDFIAKNDPSQFLCLNPESPLTAGATPALLLTSRESYPSGYRFISAGTVEDPPPGGGATVPEPSTIVLAVFGMVGVFVLISRRLLAWLGFELVGKIHFSE